MKYDTSILRDPTNLKDCFISIGVLSASTHKPQRDAIRTGWGTSPHICQLKFFIATNSDPAVVQQVQKESDHHNDIVSLPHIVESYYNITHQTMEIFKTMTQGNNATYVMKVDDDTYVRMDLLVNFLRNINYDAVDVDVEKRKKENVYIGYLERSSSPVRDVESKFYMNHKSWPGDYLPTWAHGAGYILSVNLARVIAENAAVLSSTGKFYHLEDLSTGVWVDFAKDNLKIDVEMVHDTRFNYFPTCLDIDFISHHVSTELQACLADNNGECAQCGAFITDFM